MLNFDYDSRANESIAPYGENYRVRMVQDNDAESPREWCNITTMLIEHRRYTLGDGDALSDTIAAVRASRDYRATWEETESGLFKHDGKLHDCLDLSDASQCWQAMRMCSDIISEPIYLYEHSGITISTGGFSCPWDSGMVGFVFITLDKIKAESPYKRLTAQAIQWASRQIDAEIDTYDDYIRGDCYGYIVERLTGDDNWSDVDSCWGFIGTNPDESGLAEQALDAIKYDIAKRHTARLATLKTILRNRVPLDKRAAMLVESSL